MSDQYILKLQQSLVKDTLINYYGDLGNIIDDLDKQIEFETKKRRVNRAKLRELELNKQKLESKEFNLTRKIASIHKRIENRDKIDCFELLDETIQHLIFVTL